MRLSALVSVSVSCCLPVFLLSVREKNRNMRKSVLQVLCYFSSVGNKCVFFLFMCVFICVFFVEHEDGCSTSEMVKQNMSLVKGNK